MSNFVLVTVKVRATSGTENHGATIAEAIIEATEPHRVDAFMLDALENIGILSRSDASAAEGLEFEYSPATEPFGFCADKTPLWQNDQLKVWSARGPSMRG